MKKLPTMSTTKENQHKVTNATKWLKPITKDLNELIGLNEYDYYLKVLKTIIIRSTK